MKKYLISTLTAAAAMAVPAFADATLLGSWDFSQVSQTTGSIASTSGSLTLTTGSSVSDGNLVITSDSSADHETTIDLSSQSISVAEGVSVVITLTDWSFISKNNILASIADSTRYDYAAAGLKTPETGGAFTGTGSGDLWGAANGSDSNATTTSGTLTFTEGVATEIIITFIGDTITLYQDGNLIGTTTFSGSYSADATITGVAIGSWDSAGGSGSSTSSEPSSLTISSLEIWRGDVTTLPEPSMFGLMFGLGAIGLVATRRRKRA